MGIGSPVLQVKNSRPDGRSRLPQSHPLGFEGDPAHLTQCPNDHGCENGTFQRDVFQIFAIHFPEDHLSLI